MLTVSIWNQITTEFFGNVGKDTCPVVRGTSSRADFDAVEKE
jgi:hypothetical protein